MIILVGSFFLEITIIISLAAFLSLVFKFFKQPAILAYILTGILIGPFGGFQFQNLDVLKVFGEFGLALLLFMIGLELKFKELKNVGLISLTAGVFQVIVTFFLAFLISKFFGNSNLSSFYIGSAFTFSSTVIVLKLLSEQKQLNSLHGKISIGILVLQDLFAILVLIILTGIGNGSSFSFFDFFLILLKGVLVLSFVVFLSKKVLPKITDFAASSLETLFLFSIAFAFILSALVAQIGFSIEIGAFLAGLSLANSSENFQIASRIKALRDFFIVIFFVTLGMNMSFENSGNIVLEVIIFSLFVLLLKPLIIMVLLGLGSYKKRTSFLTGISLGQISEFSLVMVFLGLKLNQLNNSAASLVTIVAVITFAISVYLIKDSNKFYKTFEKYLDIFERKTLKDSKENLSNFKDHVVLIGANRTGKSILAALIRRNHEVIVVDFNPEIVKDLNGKGIKSIFGDIGDIDIQDKAMLGEARLVISTIENLDDNLFITKFWGKKNRKAKIIVMAEDGEEAKKLYKAGADYVILPHLAGGRQIAKLLSEGKLNQIGNLKRQDLEYLS